MIKIILVPVDGSEQSVVVLKTALIVANRFCSHIKVVHVRERASEPFLFSEMSASYREEFEKFRINATDSTVDTIRAQFETVFRQADIEIVEHPGRGDTVSASLHILDGDPGTLLGSESRLVDVVAMSRPFKHRIGGPGVGERLESILLHSGRPVLIVPPDWSAHRVDHAVIGWNDSVEASRALFMTLPWLTQMSCVSVLVAKKREANVAKVIEYLNMHGCEAQYHLLSKKGANTGQKILNTCSDIDADFLVIGGFSRARTRQRLFGGVTTYLLKNTNIITVMAH